MEVRGVRKGEVGGGGREVRKAESGGGSGGE